VPADSGYGHLQLIAMRAIEEGEEELLSYGAPYARHMDCRCQESVCLTLIWTCQAQMSVKDARRYASCSPSLLE
jgi:hypothetical protein